MSKSTNFFGQPIYGQLIKSIDFPLRYFYGESAQIWVTLIANLLLSVLQASLERRWSFSGLATMVRIVLMYYLNLKKFLNQPDADMKAMLEGVAEPPPESIDST